MLLMAVILAAFAPAVLNSIISFIISGGIVGFFGGYIVWKMDKNIITNRFALVPFTIIGLVLVSHQVFQVKPIQFARLTLYLELAGISIFVLPSWSDSSDALTAINIIATIVVLVESLVYIVPEGYTATVPLTMIAIQPLGQLIVGNPNTVGILAGVGSIGGLYRLLQMRLPTYGILFVICTTGVILSLSRGVWLAFGIATTVIFLDWVNQPNAAIAWIIFSFAGIIFLILTSLFEISNIYQVSLSNRGFLWEASIQAFKKKPIVGYGLMGAGSAIEPFVEVDRLAGRSEHNSYLRMLVATGITGSIFYMSMHIAGLWKMSSRLFQSHVTPALPFLVFICVVQVFEAMTFLGTTTSVIVAMAVGYSLSRPTPNQKRELTSSLN